VDLLNCVAGLTMDDTANETSCLE